jgi:hypothetical protein
VLKKTAVIFLFILLVYSLSMCKNIFSAASEPVTENYYQVFLPKTGQTTCYDNTNEIPCSTTSGQDGNYQRGASWPNPRFIDNNNGTITDRLTGLMWVKNGNLMTSRDPNVINLRKAFFLIFLISQLLVIA